MAIMSFIIIFFSGLNPSDLFNQDILLIAFFKGACGAILLWFVGFVISDIVLKSVLEDIPMNDLDRLDGGIIQRIHKSKNDFKIVNTGNNEEETNAKEDGSEKKIKAKEKK